MDTTAPNAPIVNITTDSNNNGQISPSELAAGVDVKIDLPANAVAGDKLTIVDQSGHTVVVLLTAAEIATRSVTLDNKFTAPAQGTWLNVTATLTDGAGNVSAPGSDRALIETPPPPPAPVNVTGVYPANTIEGSDLYFTVFTTKGTTDTAMKIEIFGGSATLGIDTGNPIQINIGQGWVNFYGTQISVPASTERFQVKVPTIQDTLVESDEQITLQVTSMGTGRVERAQGTIIDDDRVATRLQGMEDGVISLTLAHFQPDPSATKVRITELPQDGRLEYLHVTPWSQTWTTVYAGQEFSRSDIDGKLRFVPDSNESGCDAYGGSGVGNRQGDYARFAYVNCDQNWSYSAGKIAFDITPTADLDGLSVTAACSIIGTVHTYSFTASGAVDTDGSERTRIAVKAVNWANNDMKIVDGDTGAVSWAVADGSGHVWIDPNDKIQVNAEWGMGGATFSSIEYKFGREEVDGAGRVLHAAYPTDYLKASASTPLVLDLNGDGVQTVGLEHGVSFDLNADGKKEQTGWTDGKDGLLVLDRNGNGQVDNGMELFGNATKLGDGSTAKDGFVALADLDSNGDGVISADDALFGQLQVWVDRNQDGLTQEGELLGLGEVGVVSFQLDAQQTDVVQNGNLIGLTSSYTKADGSRHELVDVWFGTQASDSDADVAHLQAADLLQAPTHLDAVLGKAALTQDEAPAPAVANVNLDLAAARLHVGFHHDMLVEQAHF